MCIHVHWKHSKMSMHQYFIVFPQLLAIQCVWQYGFIWQLNFLFSSSLWHSVFLSLSVSGEVKYANYAQVRLVPQLFASSSSLSLWQTTLGCLPQLVVAMNFATKNAQAAQEAGWQREREGGQYSCYLMPKILQLQANSKLELQSCQTCFCRTKPKWSVFSVVLLACGTCCMPHCGTQYHGNLKSRA